MSGTDNKKSRLQRDISMMDLRIARKRQELVGMETERRIMAETLQILQEYQNE